MTDEPAPSLSLAPLQRVMLWDSLAAGGAGHHVEQVEIVLAPGLTCEHVVVAWAATVARTAALRTAFLTVSGMPVGSERVEPRKLLDLEQSEPGSWESWLESDRCRPLLTPHEVPWRAVYWHRARRFIWTFHHALLDGRSIARVLQGFAKRLAGKDADDLTLSEWREPSSEMVALAGKMFDQMPVFAEAANVEFLPERNREAVRCLGNSFAIHLESMAAAMEVTAATILTWAWGQALAKAAGTAAVLVEQVRAGPPQTGTAGFTMNTLPVIIRRAADGGIVQSLRELRAQLVALREIEEISADDFPPGVHPNMNGPGSSVIMIERGTLRHTVGNPEIIESMVLHEAKGETLMATAYLLPDLRLEVDGPDRQRLLGRWIVVLERLVCGIYPAGGAAY